MPDSLKRFRTFTTDHCVTGSMRHIYEFHGYPVSEDLLLGLGAGVGFVYWHMKGMTPFLGGRANTGRPGEEGLEKTAGRRTGVAVECFQTASASKGQAALRQALSKGPVMIRVDMGFLPYLGLPEGYHFGGHAVVVAGVNSAGEVLIADRDNKLHAVAQADLDRARNSKFKPFSPRNAMFTFDFSASRRPEPKETMKAIAEAASGMLHGPISNLGVRGIRKAADCIPKWLETMRPDELRNACFNAFIFIDSKGGTGGGIFRYMYGRFLNEAADITGERELRSVGEQMTETGQRWRVVAEKFKLLCEPAKASSAGFSEIAGLLKEIADKEEMIWRRLETLT